MGFIFFWEKELNTNDDDDDDDDDDGVCGNHMVTILAPLVTARVVCSALHRARPRIPIMNRTKLQKVGKYTNKIQYNVERGHSSLSSTLSCLFYNWSQFSVVFFHRIIAGHCVANSFPSVLSHEVSENTPKERERERERTHFFTGQSQVLFSTKASVV